MNSLRCYTVTSFYHYNDVTDRRAAGVRLFVFYCSVSLVWVYEIELSHMGKNSGNPNLVCENNTFQRVNIKCYGLTAQMRRLVCAYVFCIQWSRVFSYLAKENRICLNMKYMLNFSLNLCTYQLTDGPTYLPTYIHTYILLEFCFSQTIYIKCPKSVLRIFYYTGQCEGQLQNGTCHFYMHVMDGGCHGKSYTWEHCPRFFMCCYTIGATNTLTLTVR